MTPIKLPPLPNTEYRLGIPGGKYEREWISNAEAWDDVAMEAYATAAVEADRARQAAEVERLRADAERYREGLSAVNILICESEGVYGLHLNGDPAPWFSLRSGGKYESWLIEFDDAMKETP